MYDDARWSAVVSRDPASDKAFVYCVKTTKIFCRPTCKARLARRANVEFFETPVEAETAGYRSCKRCRPDLPCIPGENKIEKACEILARSRDRATIPSLDQIAKEVGLTKHHFHRLFKRETGQTPHQYAQAVRGRFTVESSTSDDFSLTPLSSDSNETTISSGNGQSDFGDRDSLNPAGLRGCPSLGLDPSLILYTLIATIYGPLLVAFQGGQAEKVELGISEPDLMNSFKAAFPALQYKFLHIDMVDDSHTALLQHKIDGIVEALENPSGKILNVSTSSICSI